MGMLERKCFKGTAARNFLIVSKLSFLVFKVSGYCIIFSDFSVWPVKKNLFSLSHWLSLIQIFIDLNIRSIGNMANKFTTLHGFL
jgi:hypothetical protein